MLPWDARHDEYATLPQGPLNVPCYPQAVRVRPYQTAQAPYLRYRHPSRHRASLRLLPRRPDPCISCTTNHTRTAADRSRLPLAAECRRLAQTWLSFCRMELNISTQSTPSSVHVRVAQRVPAARLQSMAREGNKQNIVSKNN